MMRRGSVALLTLLVAFGPATSFAQEAPAAKPAPAPGTPPMPAPAPADGAAPPEVAAPAPAEQSAPVAAPPAATEAKPSTTPVEAPATDQTQADETADESAYMDAGSAEAALAALGADDSEGAKLSIYGFTDFTYSRQLGERSLLGSPYPSFAIGNLNVYLGAELGQGFRSLAEIRFLYLPHGTTPVSSTSATPTRIDTSTADYTEMNRPVRWGGIEIERAWLERSFHELLTLRVGQWLTPYGIWNVDHGSPVIIGVRRPYIIGEALLPERQTGIQAYGGLFLDSTQLGYHLTLSNGRGPIDSYQDLDDNKGVGGRLFLKNDSTLGAITFGLSGYTGKYTDRRTEYRVDESGAFVAVDPVTLEYDELSLAADVKWEKAGFLLQSEAILQDVAYAEGGRLADPGYSGGPPGFTPDSRRLGFYALTGYRIPEWNLMPFFGGEYYRVGMHAFLPDSVAFWGGLNYRPSPQIILKTQLTHVYFPTEPANGASTVPANALDFQVAWSF